MRTPIKTWEAVLFILTLLACVFIGIQLSEARAQGIQGQQFINLGLDLRGGVDITYHAIPPPGEPAVTPEMLTGAIEILGKRIDPEGVKEIVIQAVGTDRIAIQVPGEDDADKIKQSVGKTALLRFVDSHEFLTEDAVVLVEGEENLDPTLTPEDIEGATTVRPEDVIVEGSSLTRAVVSRDMDTGGFQVNLDFDREGAKAFADFTARNVNQPFSIVLDNRVISSPRVVSPILTGNGRITGNYSLQEAQDFCVLLNSGALPVKLEVLASQTVGPTLGESAINTSLVSLMIGIGLVSITLILFYRLLGVMANLALVLYALLFIGLLAGFQATLTLPGIAGFILSIGMAVDANILVFERMKEELNSGKAFGHSLALGYSRALPAIADGHICSIVSGVLLYSLGTGAIKGFAVTLIIGNILSLYTALFTTRMWTLVFLQGRGAHKPGLLGYGVKVVNG